MGAPLGAPMGSGDFFVARPRFRATNGRARKVYASPPRSSLIEGNSEKRREGRAMTTGPIRNILRRVRELARGRPPDGPGDGGLLERFARRRDEGAFALLLRRHGPMVLGVCRRVLGHEQDAEDAFQ